MKKQFFHQGIARKPVFGYNFYNILCFRAVPEDDILKKTIAFILAFAMILSFCACGQKEVEYHPKQTNEPQQTQPAAKPAPAAVPTPAAAEPVKEPEPEPEPEPQPEFTNPLTGEGVWEDISSHRPYAIMLNNLTKALPQCSQSNADLIFEMQVEGGITRMIALYQDITSCGAIGSVRSSRPYYLDVVTAFDAIYIHAGGSEQAYSDIRTRGITNIDGVRGSGTIFYRDSARKASAGYEHSMFTSEELISKYVPDMNIRHDHKEGYQETLKFTAEPDMKGAVSASAVTVVMNPTKSTKFAYDEESGRYLVSEYGKEYIDGNTGEQVSVKNVLVLYVKYSNIAGDDKGRLRADMSGGKAVYIANGRMIEGCSWSRTDSGFVLTKADGSPLELAVGNSYVCCANAGSGSVSAE